jgi:putative SOS response-associated peptidase YedK
VNESQEERRREQGDSHPGEPRELARATNDEQRRTGQQRHGLPPQEWIDRSACAGNERHASDVARETMNDKPPVGFGHA